MNFFTELLSGTGLVSSQNPDTTAPTGGSGSILGQILGIFYPAQTPATSAAKNPASGGATAVNYLPWILGGLATLALIVVLLIAGRKK